MKKIILLLAAIILPALLCATENKSTDALLREIDGIIKNRQTYGVERQVVHLLNFSQANSLSWRDVDVTMPEPALITGAVLQMNFPAKVNKLWVASPDVHGGALQELNFTQENGVVSFTLPSLKYWTMIVVE